MEWHVQKFSKVHMHVRGPALRDRRVWSLVVVVVVVVVVSPRYLIQAAGLVTASVPPRSCPPSPGRAADLTVCNIMQEVINSSWFFPLLTALKLFLGASRCNQQCH